MSMDIKTKEALEALQQKVDWMMQNIQSCQDGGCIIEIPKGQHTNGGCRCWKDTMTMKKVAYVLRYMRDGLDGILREGLKKEGER